MCEVNIEKYLMLFPQHKPQVDGLKGLQVSSSGEYFKTGENSVNETFMPFIGPDKHKLIQVDEYIYRCDGLILSTIKSVLDDVDPELLDANNSTVEIIYHDNDQTNTSHSNLSCQTPIFNLKQEPRERLRASLNVNSIVGAVGDLVPVDNTSDAWRH